jgi:outer membrane protein assembly factor BamB
MLRVVVAVATAVAGLTACSGSRSALPGVLSAPGVAEHHVHTQAIGSVPGDVVAIDAGGASAGGFAADTDVRGDGTWPSVTSKPIDTTAVAVPAPQAVYASARIGSTFSYAIGGLTPNTPYTLQLSFAEFFWSSPGKRIFNVSANGAPMLTGFDIIAAAGGANKAVTRSALVTADAGGTITVGFSTVTDHAAVNAIEVMASGATPVPTATPTSLPNGGLAIDAGGAATGNYAADEDFTAAGTWTYATTAPIATGAVTDPAPQAVYQSQRDGSSIAYTIPGLVAGAAYTVRLDFAELFFSAVGQRVFDVSINGTGVLTNFDIVKAAGAADTAIAQTFTTTATPGGTIAIAFTPVTNYPAVNGITVVPVAGALPTPTPTPPPGGFNDYATFGYDSAHDVYNPNSTAITPATIGNLHLAWQASLGDFNTQTQPVLATNVGGHSALLFVGGGSGRIYAYDALSGSLVWKTQLGNASISGCGSGAVAGTGGTPAYDPASKSLYVVANGNGNVVELAHLDAASGTVLGTVNVAPPQLEPGEGEIGHTAVTLRGGVAYLGVGSYCDASPWRGMLVAVNVPSLAIAGTYFTVWDPQNARGGGAQPWSGASIWGWGGVSLDAGGNVLAGVGNTDNGGNGPVPAPFVAAPQEWSGLGDAIAEFDPGLATTLASNHPIPPSVFGGQSVDLDVQGTPLVFTPNGTSCAPMVAIQAKAGTLSLYNEGAIASGPIAQYQMAPSAWSDSYLGGPTYSAATGLLYADVASSTSPSLFAPGLIAINPGCGTPSVAWNAAYGIDSSTLGVARGVPAVSAGGVVFSGTAAGNGTGGALWAIDASAGTVLGGGAPILTTGGYIRMPATIDGDWVFVLDNSGNLYALTADSRYAAIAARKPASALRAPHWRPALRN